MPAWIWMTALGFAAVAAAVVLVRRRLARLDRRETLFWARRNAREAVDTLHRNVPRMKHLASDPQLGPALEQRVAGHAARLQQLEQRFDGLPPGLAGEFDALRHQCEAWHAALAAIERVHEAAAYPQGYVAGMESRVGRAEPPAAAAVKPRSSRAPKSTAATPEQQVAALRRALDGLDERHRHLKARILSDPPSSPSAPQADALYDAYRELGGRIYPLWKQLCPAEARAAEAQADALFGQFVDFQQRFGEAQARDRRAQAEIERREQARRGDDDPNDPSNAIDRWTLPPRTRSSRTWWPCATRAGSRSSRTTGPRPKACCDRRCTGPRPAWARAIR